MKIKVLKQATMKEAMKEELISDYKDELTTPTILIELDCEEYKCCQNNIIELSSSSIEKGTKSKKCNCVFIQM